MQPRSWALAAALAGMIGAGCTTVSRPGVIQGAGGVVSGPGETLPSGAPAAIGTGPATGPAGVAGGGAVTVNGGGTATPVGQSSGGSAIAPGGSANSPAGRTCTKPVKIGVSYSSDEAAGLAAVGNPGEAGSLGAYVKQQQATYQRMADAVNQHGGLAGCKVVLGYHDFKSLGSDGFSGESQAECVDFAEDQHVFAVINTTLENKTLISCLAQHHVVDLYYGSTYSPTPQDFAADRGYLYLPSAVGIDRWAPFIDELAAAGYFPAGAKVGILVADDGSGNNEALVNNIWKPKLAARGITPVVFNYSQIEGYSDVTQTTSQFGSAVLAFKQAGVDHVMATPDNGDVTIFFTQTAQSQNYHPRYALTSASGPAAWSTEPAGQRPNALDISYSWLDLSPAPGSPVLNSIPTTPARAQCDALYKNQLGSSSVANVYGICDAFDFLVGGLAHASDVTPATLLAGVDAMGSSLSLAEGFGNASFHPPDRYDGGVVTRTIEWDEAAQTWKFIGSPWTIP